MNPERLGEDGSRPLHDEERTSSRRADVEAVAAELLGLPNIAAPESVWQGVRERVDRRKTVARYGRAGRSARRFAPMAVAASVMLGVLVTLLVVATPPADAPPTAAAAAPDLLGYSRRLESWRRVTPAGHPPTAAVRVLRARIGGIDASLNHRLLGNDSNHVVPAGAMNADIERQRLLRERVELLESLVYIEQYRQHELVREAVF